MSWVNVYIQPTGHQYNYVFHKNVFTQLEKLCNDCYCYNILKFKILDFIQQNFEGLFVFNLLKKKKIILSFRMHFFYKMYYRLINISLLVTFISIFTKLYTKFS